MLGSDVDHIIALLSRLPGVGQRSARRIALHMLGHRDTIMKPLSERLGAAAENIQDCSTCHSLDTQNPCAICTDSGRERHTICVVEHIADLWAVERTGAYKGLYHVLGGVLSPLDGVGPDDLHIPHLKQRVEATDTPVLEVIIALNATVEGQTTAHYISDVLKGVDVKVTRLARGVPMGSALDYLDDNTVVTALRARSSLNQSSSG